MRATQIVDATDFGRAVRAARKEVGLSQVQLAQRCGCSQRFVSEVERGKASAELGRALSLMAALDVPVTAGAIREDMDGRAEVRYALVRIASQLDEQPRKRKPLSDYLE